MIQALLFALPIVMSTAAVESPWLSRFPLRVEHGKIVDAHGERFRLIGINWYGASDIEHVVGGLAKRNLRDIAQTIADMGFTVVRLPFSNQMMRSGVEPRPGSIDFDLNPELKGKTPMEVLDAVIDALGACQVAVIPNNHCSFAAWGGNVDANGLWFCDEPCGDPPSCYPEDQFFADWQALARRYSSRPWVVGYDLRNEVRPVPGSRTKWPVWGGPSGDRTRGFLSGVGVLSYHDWWAAAGTAGRLILEANPDKLIVVERIVLPAQSLDLYVRSPPEGIPSSRLVYGVHAYAWTGPGIYIPDFETAGGWNAASTWKKSLLDSVRTSALARSLGGCRDARTYAKMSPEEQAEWYVAQWGRVLSGCKAPVWLSEFGCNLEASDEDTVWFRTLADHLVAYDLDFAYWPLNGSPKPSGDDENYGLLGENWMPHETDWRLSLLVRASVASVSESPSQGC